MAKRFTLEALDAKHGDCLLLHWGTEETPRTVLIDGGPNGVWSRSLSKRLNELRTARGTPLKLEGVMVSHVDDDHIRGILDLTDRMERKADAGEEPHYIIDELYFNAFDDIVGNVEVAAFTTPGAAPAGLAGGEALIASVGQGRTLRDRANKLGLRVNKGAKLLTSGATVPMGDGLTFQILGPGKRRLQEFQEAWDKEVKKNGWDQQGDAASIAAFLDTSPWNLASTIVLAKHGSRTMLLTGDARGDDILEGLEEANLLTGASMKVNLLKVPHHGSDRNVSTEFFRRVRADHYVISGDGEHKNPDMATLEMILDARGSSDFQVHLTYREGIKGHKERLEEFLAGLKKSARDKFQFRENGKLSLSVDL
jgi:beta-lactamase superfamily II metal-dependent hydrolase